MVALLLEKNHIFELVTGLPVTIANEAEKGLIPVNSRFLGASLSFTYQIPLMWYTLSSTFNWVFDVTVCVFAALFYTDGQRLHI